MSVPIFNFSFCKEENRERIASGMDFYQNYLFFDKRYSHFQKDML